MTELSRLKRSVDKKVYGASYITRPKCYYVDDLPVHWFASEKESLNTIKNLLNNQKDGN